MNDSVRLWLVTEEDRGLGNTILSCHPTEENAIESLASNQYVDYIDIPIEVYELIGISNN